MAQQIVINQPANLAAQTRPKAPQRDKIIVFGVLMTLVCLGGFALWAGFVPLTEGVFATGTVVVDSNRKAIQHLEGGIVKKIKISNGSVVKAGDVLIELDETQIQAEINLLQTRQDSLQTLISRLQAERLGREQIVYPEDISARARDNAELRELVAVQDNLFVARNEQYEGQVQILRQRIGQLKEQIIGLESQMQSAKSEEKLLKDDLRTLQDLRAQQLTEQTAVNDKQRELAQLRGRIGGILSEIARNKIAIGEAEEQIIQVGRSQNQEVSDGLSEAQERLYGVEEQLTAKIDVLNRTKIIAPQNGIVMNLGIHTVGGVVQAARPIMEIIPQGDRLVIEARINATDVDNVYKGQTTRVRFSAFRMRTTPTLEATVDNVSADANIDENTQIPYYQVKVSVSAQEMEKMGEEQVLPGMPVEVLITGGDKTAFEYLLDPILFVFNRALIEE